MPIANELPIDTSATAEDMANAIFGDGVVVNSAQYFGDAQSSGTYSNGDTISGGVVPADTGVILSTGAATDFTNNSGTTNTNQSGSTGTNTGGVNNDGDMNAIAGGSTFDASILEVNFTPSGNYLTLDFVISSEEYPEFVNSQFLDVVGIWINGVEAQVSIGTGTASVGTINGSTTPNLYNDNTGDQYNTEMDGFTITLSVVAPVNPGVPNTIKIGVADVADSAYDTNLLIAGDSAQSTIVAQDDQETFGHNDTKTLDVLANDSSTAGTLTITHINGQSISPGGSVTLSTGQQITLNADGTLTVVGDADAETVYFNYTIEDTSGNTDTGLVEIEQVPCFTAGTRIETAQGPKPVEALKVGDLVPTRDNGLMPILWIGRHRVLGLGTNRPVRISTGMFGATRDILVSPNHRVLLTGYWADLLFGATEVLARAKDLVNGTTVCWEPVVRHWTYFHLLLARHEMLQSDGLISESFQPGQSVLSGFDEKALAEIHALFPALAQAINGYGPAARPTLKPHEAALLMRLSSSDQTSHPPLSIVI